jgi:hypothetical protein
MTSESSAEDWPDYPEGLDEKSVSYREKRCTWHGVTCPEDPVKVVRTRDGRRWAACARGVLAIAAARESGDSPRPGEPGYSGGPSGPVGTGGR